MTEIDIVSSGSTANGYLLKSGGETLVLELGCKFLDYAQQERNLNNIVGCVASHAHIDHLNRTTLQQFVKRGVPCYAAKDVVEEWQNCSFPLLLPNYPNKVGGFTIQTFPAPHNVPNSGFLITTPTNERILFLTDTTGVNLRFKDINAILIECNHDNDTLLDNLANHDVSLSHPEFHLGLDECKEFCRQNISASTKQIILIHLSHTNVNESHAIQNVKEHCNFDNVAVAHKGDVFKIDNDDF